MLNLLSKILAGSAVGYITNYLAVQMLFREYLKIGKWSLGGVIIKERKEFESQISKLVESDVLHRKAIIEAMQNPEFKQALADLTQHLFQESLPHTFSEDFLAKDIPAIDNILAQIQNLVAEVLDFSQENHLLKHFAENLQLTQILDTKTNQNLGTWFSQTLQKFLQQDSFSIFLNDLLKNLQTAKINDFISENTSQKIGENLQSIFKDLHLFLKANYAEAIEKILQDAEDFINIPALLSQLATQIADKSIAEVLGAKNSENLPKAILAHLQDLFEQDNNEEIIKILLKKLIEILEKEETTVFDLLSDNLKENFEDFLTKRLPKIIQEIIPWIQSKKAKLEHLIEESFNQQVSTLGRVLVQIFLGKIGEYINPSQRIVQILEQQNPQELSEQASQFLVDFLKKNTIADIVKQFKNQILTTLSPILHQNLQKTVKNIDNSIFKNIFEQKIANFLPETQIQNWLDELLVYIRQNYLKEKLIFSPRLSDFVQENLKIQLDKFLAGDFSQFLRPEKQVQNTDTLQNLILQTLEKQQSKLSERISQEIQNFIQKKQLSDIFKFEENAQLQKLIQQGIQRFLDKSFKKFKENPLQKYVTLLQDNEKVATQLADYLHKYLLENLESFFEGKVEILVKESLERLPPEKLRAMMYKALGKEFQPLSIFGGILGSVTGGILSVLPNPSANLVGLGISGLAYGGTGWGTNWLAIKMLFRPYKARFFPFTRKRLPMTPGVIAKNKARFANSMGRFIGDKLLNPDSLQETFSENQEKLSQALIEILSKDEYAILESTLSQNQAKISQNLSNWILKTLENQDSNLSQTLEKWLKNDSLSFQNLDTHSIENNILEYLDKVSFAQSLESTLLIELEKYLAQNPELSQLIPKNLKENLDQNIAQALANSVQVLEQELAKEDIFETINLQSLEEYLQAFLGKNLDEILTPEQEEKFKTEIFKFLRDRIQSENIQASIFDFVNEKLSEAFNPEQKIKDIFEGRLLKLLEENLQNILKQIIQEAINYLQKNKTELADRIYEEASKNAQKQGNLVSVATVLYRNSIKNTVFDLVENGIPKFLSEEFESLQASIHQQILDLGEDSLDNQNLLAIKEDKLKNSIKNILGNYTLIRKIRQITNILLEERIFKIKLQSLLIEEDFAFTQHFKEVLNPELTLVKNHLSKQIQDEEKIQFLIKDLAEILGDIFEKLLYPLKIETLLKEVSEAEKTAVIRKLRTFLQTSEAFASHKATILQDLLKNVKQTPLSSILDINTLSKNLEQILQTYLQEHKDAVSHNLEEMIRKILDKIPEILPNETKSFLIDKAGKSVFETLKENILTLVNSLDFKKIIVSEIKNMHPKELEDLFYGFARKYFKFLIGYGFIFGIIFGLGIDFGVLELLKLMF